MTAETSEQTKLEHAVEGIRIQQANRKLWAEGDDAEKVANLLLGEAVELVDAIKESFLTGDVFSVASEIGDVLFVAFRLCDELGFDAADLIDMKTKRNSMKYSDAVLSNGYNHAEASVMSKNAWKMMGGDEAFSHAYLDVLADGAQDD